jgi:MoaA/NifB/PqqE/SkfB family radical SAM enzyme
MMRFPLRLTADLTKAKITRMFRGKVGRPLILRFDSSNLDSQSRTEAEILASVEACPAPVVWIDGGEPLLLPEIGHLARRIVDCRRHVFLETDGILLRRSIFSFRPVSRLFLTVRLSGLEHSHDLRAGRAGAFRAAMEGIRAAKLSGFFLCVKMPVYEDSNIEELWKLRDFLAPMEIDGYVVSLAPGVAKTAAAGERLRDAGKMIGGRWEEFSRLVGMTLEDSHQEAKAASDFTQRETPKEDACEEGVRVP